MNSKKATMEVLDEDTIMEIVVRLPLKYAIRCTVLNKNLFRLISQQKKALVSSAYPDIGRSIFSRYNEETFKRNTPGSSNISITIPKRSYPDNPVILDSCNGVLLLNFLEESQVCVFNPITSGIMPLSTFIKLEPSEVTIALAVDLDAQTSFQFKLVVAETVSLNKEETLWRFTVFVPSGSTSWLIKSPVELICRGGPSSFIQSVYVRGCVYWDGEMDHSIVMFDVEKEEARSVRSPVEGSAFLFGTSDGSLMSLYTLEDEFEIHSYDQVKDGWQLKHRIAHTVSNPVVRFCNGQHLLITDEPPFWSRDLDEVHLMYDILSDKWEKTGPEDFSNITDTDNVFSFVPTLAKVSDMYMHNPKFEFAQVYLRGLQRLVMQETRDVEVIG